MCGTHPTVTKLIDYEQFCGVAPAAPDGSADREQLRPRSRPVELKQRLDRGDELMIVDVREPNEYQINRIAGLELIPLGELPQRYGELDPDDEIVVSARWAAAARKRRISCGRSGSSAC